MSTPIHVLILEDRAADAELMLHELRKAGFDADWQRVEAEPDYLTALETNPDLILADWSLPQFSGQRALQLMNELGLDIPFIIVSGSIGEETAIEAMRQGASDYLLKDRPARLGQAVQLALNDKRLREERKKAEDALRTSEDKFKYVFEHSRVGISFTLISGEINVNQAFCEIVGYSQEELKNRKWQEITHPEDLELTQNEINALLSGEKNSVRFIKRYIHKNGSIAWVDLASTLRRDRDGNPLYLISVLNDITERKQAEKALLESERRHRAIYEGASIGIAFGDLAGHFIDINPALQRILGYRKEELSGKTLAELTHPDDLATDFALFQETIKGQRQQYQIEKRYFHKDGHIVWGNAHITIVHDANGNPEYAIGMVEDITERKRAEEEIHELNAKLEQRVEERTRELRQAQEQLVRSEKLAILGQLAGGVGHELRNPLSVINTSIYFLKLVQPEADEKIKEYHAMIEQEVHNADKIISDLLDYARVISSDRKLVSAARLVRQTLKRYPVPPAVKLKRELPDDIPNIYADPRQVEQVLGNLVTNACQAMNQEGKLTISVRLEKNMVGIDVKDTGTGISPENMKKLFEPLFTTKAKGIGLGLAVSRKLAEANGGRIEVESEVGKGSTFTLYLPINGTKSSHQ